ncbi:MAG: hypothetical protein CR991_02590 [Proteobacteria bacterium]|nr:MAG: hypothetical protein CR991_02590 [Pseudomonadota bacterium]
MKQQGCLLLLIMSLLQPFAQVSAQDASATPSTTNTTATTSNAPSSDPDIQAIEASIQQGKVAFENDNYDTAIKHFNKAITLAESSKHQHLRAASQVNLGNALMEKAFQTQGDKGLDSLNQSIGVYRQSLQVFTRQDKPILWALVLNKLGFALQTKGVYQGGEEGMKLLQEATDSYRNSLSVRTRKDMPEEWAETNNSLASVLHEMSNLNEPPQSDKYLQEAVDLYLLALEAVKRNDEPERWAQIQDNLGRALWDQSMRPGLSLEIERGLLEKALELFRSALTVRTAADYPYDYEQSMHHLAEVSNNLAFNLIDIPERKAEARKAINEALAIHPDDPYYLDTLGWLDYHSGKPEKALTSLEKSLEIMPYSQNAGHLIEVYWHLGKKDKARSLLDDMLKQFPDDPYLTELSRKVISSKPKN